jgi:phosphoribosylglycinamide formyltransferase-1
MRLGWAVSGNGHASRAIVLAHEAGLLDTTISLYITDRPSPILNFAGVRSIPVVEIRPDSPDFNPKIIRAIERHALDWLGLTFNRLLSDAVIDVMGGRIFNLHMALAPAFPGFNPISKALKRRVRFTGATVHLIDAGMDSGPILAQCVVPVLPDDTESMLGARIFGNAVPAVLQIIRSIERGEIVLKNGQPEWFRKWKKGSFQFPEIDDDLLSFAADFCAQLQRESG